MFQRLAIGETRQVAKSGMGSPPVPLFAFRGERDLKMPEDKPKQKEGFPYRVETAAPGNFLPHIAMQIYNTPLMILPQKLEVITRVLGPRIGLDEGEVQATEMVKARPPAKTNQVEIAVIPIIGSLVHRTSGLGAMSGMRSYTGIRSEYREAMNDSKINAILLDIDTSGGAVAGVFDLVDEFYAGNQAKPLYAYVNEHAYSAGYALASPARKIFLPRTGGVGSIGVRMMHVDQSEFNKKEGITVTNLFVGERKVDFDPHSPLSKEAYESAMKELRDIYDLFAEITARNRGLSVAEVKGTEAALYMGQHAVRIGLADEVMTFDEAIEFIVDDVAANKNSNAAQGMANKKEVKHTMPNLAEFKAESPDLYKELMALARTEAEGALQSKFKAEREGLQEQITTLKGDLKSQGEIVLKLKEDSYIRSVQEQNSNNERDAETIWVKALSTSDIPEGMHPEIQKMVRIEDHLKDKALDGESFQAAVEAKIAQWEGKGMTTKVLGTGFGGSKVGTETNIEDLEAQNQEKDDDEWVDSMLALGGQKIEKGGEK